MLYAFVFFIMAIAASFILDKAGGDGGMPVPPILTRLLERSLKNLANSKLARIMPVCIVDATVLRQAMKDAVDFGKNNCEPVLSLSSGSSANALENAIELACIETFIRPSGGRRGIKEVIERVIPTISQEMWREAGGEGDVHKEWGDIEKDLTYFEFPSRQGYSEWQDHCLNRLLAKWMTANKAVCYQGANSAIGVKCFNTKGLRTPLSILLDMLSGPQGCVDVQQYVMSVLGATVKAPLGKREGSLQQVGVKVLAYDFKRPIGKDNEGNDIFLSDVGTDGGSLASIDPLLFPSLEGLDVFDPNRIMGGQVRGVTSSGIIKGTAWPALVYGGEQGKDFNGMKTFSITTEGKVPVLLLDLNMFKGGMKSHNAVLAAKDKNAPDGYGIEITDDMWCWFIANQRHIEETRMSQGSSFQETPFRLKDNLKVDPVKMLANFKKSIEQINDEKKSTALNGFILRASNRFKAEECPEHQLPLVQSVDRRIDRLASSGDRREAHIRYVRACSLLPCGSVITTKQSWGRGKCNILSKVALKRTPNLLYSCLSTAWGLTMPLIRALDMVEDCDLDDPIGFITNGYEELKQELEAIYDKGYLYGSKENGKTAVTWKKLITALMQKHNSEVKSRSYNHNKRLKFKSTFKRLKQLAVAMRSVPHLGGCFFANPEDGRDRQEDHDGDYTVCDGNDWIVKIHEDAEQKWEKMTSPVIEFPKSKAKNMRDSQLMVMICGKLEINPKGMKIIEMFPTLESFSLERCVEIAKVTTVDPQGPTGLWSNAGADIFARINWKFSDCGKYVEGPATSKDQKLYYLWIICALCVQLSIDWQKRAFELFLLGKWEELADLIAKAGEKGEPVSTEDLKGLGNPPDLSSTMMVGRREYKVLAPNWCFNPEVVYPWVNSILANIYQVYIDFKPAICTWKQRPDGTWRDAGEIRQQLELYSKEGLFYRVQMAAHGENGWLKPALDTVAKSSQKWATDLHEALMKKLGGVENEKLRDAYFGFADKVNKAVPVCMRAVTLMHDISHKDESAISKLSPKLRGNTYLKALGFTSDQIKELATPIDGEKPTAVKVGNLFIDIEMLIAMLMKTPAKEGRGMTAGWQILLSWWISCNTTPESLKEFYRYAQDRFATWVSLTNKRFSGHHQMVPRGNHSVVAMMGKSIVLKDGTKANAAGACAAVTKSLEDNWESWVLGQVDDEWLEALWKEVECDEIQYKLMIKTIFRSFVAFHRSMKYLGRLKTSKQVFRGSGKIVKIPTFFSPSGGSRDDFDRLMPQSEWNVLGTGYYKDAWFERGGIAYDDGKRGLRHYNQGPSDNLRHVPMLKHAYSDPVALTWDWHKGAPPIAPAPVMQQLLWIEDLLKEGWVVKSNSCFGKKHGYLDHYGYWLSQEGSAEQVALLLGEDANLVILEDGKIHEVGYAYMRRGYGTGTEVNLKDGSAATAHHHAYSYNPEVMRLIESYISSVVGLPNVNGRPVKNIFGKDVPWDELILVKLIAGIMLREADRKVGLKATLDSFDENYDRDIMNTMLPTYRKFKDLLGDVGLYNPSLWTTKAAAKKGKFVPFFFQSNYDRGIGLIKFIETYKSLGR